MDSHACIVWVRDIKSERIACLNISNCSAVSLARFSSSFNRSIYVNCAASSCVNCSQACYDKIGLFSYVSDVIPVLLPE